MTSTYINWPTSASRSVISGKFKKMSHIFGRPSLDTRVAIFGGVDGTHIKIDKPSQYPENYINKRISIL